MSASDQLEAFFNANPSVPIGMLAVLVVLALWRWLLWRREKGTGSPPAEPSGLTPAGGLLPRLLDQLLFWLTPNDPFKVRDLMASVAIFGRTGSAKTTSSGKVLARAIVSHPKSGGLVVLPKPEDIEMWTDVFHKAGRLDDLLIFSEESDLRCNFLGCLKRPRDVVTFLTTMSEVLKRGDSKGGGGENNRFYEQMEERVDYLAVVALQAADEPISAPALHRFILTAAMSPAELQTPQWQAGYHSKVLERAFNAPKTPVQKHDFQLSMDFWVKEWPTMDPKTRSNTLAGVQNTLSTLNTGLVREMCSGGTNCSPQDALNAKWILCQFPPSAYGAAGQVISAGWKHLVELAILERHATESSPFCTIWCDESHAFVTAADSAFLAQSRSHKGSLVYLTQSVSSLYSAMPGENGRHTADALLANFSHWIVHACDPVTAKAAAAKLGRKKEILYSGSSSPMHNATIWDQMYGEQNTSASFSEHYEQELQDGVFMNNLRTGGPDCGWVADAIVIRNGSPFADGKSYQRVVFSQK